MFHSRLRTACAQQTSRLIFNSSYSNKGESSGVNEPLKGLADIPTLPTLPIIGQIHHFIPYIGMFGSVSHSVDIMDGMYKKFGPLVRVGPMLKNPLMIFLFDPDDIELVLRNENSMPVRAGFDSLQHFRHNLKKEEYGEMSGLLTQHGEGWKKFRSTVNPVLLQPQTIKSYAGTIDQVAQDMVERLKKIRNADYTISEDFEIEMNKWALESIGVVGLGGRIGCLADDLTEDSPARQLIQCVRDCFETTDNLDFRPSAWKYFATPAYKKGMAIYDKQMRLSTMYVRKAIEDIKSRKRFETPSDDKSVLEKLHEIDEKVAVIMVSDMLFAGVDTAAHTMMTLLYHLAKNPDKQNKLREEIRAGDKKYLKACTKENLRISPVVAGNIRRTTKEHRLKNYIIPEGTDIVFTHEYMSLQEIHYLRAKEFLPERWLVSKDDPLHYGHAHPMVTMPFGHGVRSCIGRRIAELEVETFLVRIIDNFQVEWDGPPKTVKTKSLNYMQPPYGYVFKDAN